MRMPRKSLIVSKQKLKSLFSSSLKKPIKLPKKKSRELKTSKLKLMLMVWN